jgi:hypothetical protein
VNVCLLHCISPFFTFNLHLHLHPQQPPPALSNSRAASLGDITAVVSWITPYSKVFIPRFNRHSNTIISACFIAFFSLTLHPIRYLQSHSPATAEIQSQPRQPLRTAPTIKRYCNTTGELPFTPIHDAWLALSPCVSPLQKRLELLNVHLLASDSLLAVPTLLSHQTSQSARLGLGLLLLAGGFSRPQHQPEVPPEVATAARGCYCYW